MVLFSLAEIFFLILTTLVVGFIFSGIIRRPTNDPLTRYQRFNWQDYWFAVMIAAPGIILHELGHKFIAILFGLDAHFQIWPTGLLLGVILKLLGTGFMIIAPGYVTIIGATPLISALTAAAGPLVNLALWIGSLLYIKHARRITRTTAVFLALLRDINKWLFIFNMIPIPPLDGFKVVQPLLATLF